MSKIRFAKAKSFLKGKGFIGALVLSVTAIGISTYLAYENTLGNITSQENKKPDTSGSVSQAATSVPDTPSQRPDDTSSAAAVDNTVSGVEKDEPTQSEPDDEQTNNFISSTSPRMLPVEGKIIWEYSGGELVKSETLGVWKTHDGIDIAVPYGTDVRAAASGTVKSVRDDPLWGVCVVIDHYDGYEGHYYGMDKALKIKENSKVEAGDIIGITAAFDCESKLEPHLHFGVKMNDKWIAPSEFVKS